MANKEPDVGGFHLQPPNGVAGIISCIEAIEQNPFLYEQKNFNSRIEAIDYIEFQIIELIEWLLPKTDQPNELNLSKERAGGIKYELQQVNAVSFQRLRESIRNKSFTREGLMSLIIDCLDLHQYPEETRNKAGYDNLDIFINELISFQPIPEVTRALEPEMIYYQKTPARVIFEMAEKCQFTEDDIFFDLGSGLGQAAILVNLLSGVTAFGVEFQPAFCDFATACAEQLNLRDVTFINADARAADYSKGTVFFLYTPFKGKIMQEVLMLLKKESLRKKIKIFTYGPCTAELALQHWLDFSGQDAGNIYSLGIFNSR